MARNPEKELTLQEKLGILRDRLGTVGEQMKNFPVYSNQRGFAELFREQERLKREIKELQDLIIPPLGHGTLSEYTITSARKPKR